MRRLVEHVPFADVDSHALVEQGPVHRPCRSSSASPRRPTAGACRHSRSQPEPLKTTPDRVRSPAPLRPRAVGRYPGGPERGASRHTLTIPRASSHSPCAPRRPVPPVATAHRILYRLKGYWASRPGKAPGSQHAKGLAEMGAGDGGRSIRSKETHKSNAWFANAWHRLSWPPRSLCVPPLRPSSVD